MVRISYREKNRINDFEDINSGGIWVYVSPGFIVKFNDSFNVFTQGDFPIYQNVNGHQLTTSYLLRVGFFVTL